MVQYPWFPVLFCFVSFFKLSWSHLFFIFPLPQGFCLQGSQKQQGLSNLHRDDKRQDTQGFGLSAKLRAKGGVFRVADSTGQVTQAQELGSRLERIRPCLGKFHKHRCSFTKGIFLQMLAHFLPTQKFYFVRSFLMARSTTILLLHSLVFPLLFSFPL